MKTTTLLFLEHECADIPLDVVAAKYLGMGLTNDARKVLNCFVATVLRFEK